MAFTKGVADEKAAFPALAKVYCTFVEEAFATLVFIRKKDTFISYENIVELYKIWSKRIKSNKITLEANSIEEQLNSKKESIKKLQEGDRLNPIGVRRRTS